MKIAIAVPLCLLITGAVSAASAVEPPTQKPGLWQVTVQRAGMPSGGRSYQICQDAASIAAGKAVAAEHLKKDCKATSSMRKLGETWVSDSDCTLSGMHIVGHSVTTVHGDGQFHTEVTSTMDMGKGGKKTDVMTMDNKWLGACKAGQKVGVPQGSQ